MKVLWITNILFPEAKKILFGGKEDNLEAGGWMLGSAQMLTREAGIKLYVASVSECVTELTEIKGEQIFYFILPYGKGNKGENREYENYWREINEKIKPDIVHIHGTEFSHGLSYVNACGSERVVVSIQGLMSAIAPYTIYGLSSWELIKNITLRDFVKGNSLRLPRIFKKRGVIEKKLLKKVNHIIGRTSWDRARTWAINPLAEYHFCNETLRKEFYTDRWEYKKCNKHTIFVSGGAVPLKGLHMILRAMPLVLREYPDAKLRVAGDDVTRSTGGFVNRIKMSDYGRVVKQLIDKQGLSQKVKFLGPLSAGQMKSEYLGANVYVQSSSIENSPNSLCEAQLLGVPCIASYVGGTMDLIINSTCGELYRFEETEMLAYKICKIFASSDSWNNITMVSEAQCRHNPATNVKKLIAIYQHIIGE